MRRILCIVVTLFLLISVVAGCGGSNTGSGGSFLENIFKSQREQPDNAPDLSGNFTDSSTYDENWKIYEGLWLDVFTSPQLHAGMSFDELFESMTSIVPIPLGADDKGVLYSQRSYGGVVDTRECDGYKAFRFGNLYIDDYIPDTYQIELYVRVYSEGLSSGRRGAGRQNKVREADIKFTRRKDRMEPDEQKALFDYLCGKLSEKFAPIPLSGEENWEYRGGEYAKFGASSGDTSRFVLTIEYGRYNSWSNVEIKIITDSNFEYDAP